MNSGGDKQHESWRWLNDFVRVLYTKIAIVTLSDALIRKGLGQAGTTVRDRTLCGLCLRIGARTNTFVVAMSVAGRQIQVTLGRWPLITVDEARELALPTCAVADASPRAAGDFAQFYRGIYVRAAHAASDTSEKKRLDNL